MGGQVRLDPEMEEALSNATMKDIMELADILNTNPQDFVMEAYADPLQYFEPDPPNTANPKEILEKLNANDKETKDVCLNNVSGITEQLFCDIFNAIKNNDQITKLSACNCDLSDFAVQTLCSVMDQNSSLKSLSIKNPRIMKAGITLEFKEVCQRVSQHMIANMDKLRITRLKDGVAPGAGVKWTAARTLD